ncbi:MAG: hypothetical protein QNJ74_16165 [Trichodesmium sp. MO_231.B1]|nr:hypothetical protein [Trichodesmium sp. MO_231.B1]
MQQDTIPALEITMGHQNPWHEGVMEMLKEVIPLYLHKDLFDLLAKGPQMWAIHSVKLDWGYLGILSISRIDTKTGGLNTEYVALGHNKDKVPSDEILAKIGDKLGSQIATHIDRVMDEMSRVIEGGNPTLPITSTHITIENIRRSLRDRQGEMN